MKMTLMVSDPEMNGSASGGGSPEAGREMRFEWLSLSHPYYSTTEPTMQYMEV